MLRFEVEVLDWCELGEVKDENDTSFLLNIPKYGSLTVAELEEISKCQMTWDWLKIGLQRPESGIAAESIEAIVQSMPMHVVTKGYEFMLSEMNQWAKPEAAEEAKKPLIGEEYSSDSTTTTPVSLEAGESSPDTLST